jgi:starch phosphorylase
VLLEGYDMHLGRMLTSGCDVWLNNPLRPQEASGTSGMKPPLHGGLNFSIPDGWWPEAANGKNGWTIGDGRSFKSRAKQDRYDADRIYDLLENVIVPEFYARDRAGFPRRWIARMKNSLATVPAQFNTHRMVGEYLRRYYLPASRA